ncbi:MAG: glutamate racemase [Acutalibacteraceae bacterium]|nr:glutamate racemase [Acutalibacteraceae bacterium]
MSEHSAIGVFDSGMGGLTAVKELIHFLPHENIVYFGDTGRVPYGNRSKETITRYAMQDARFLESKDIKILIAACGTVSSVAGDLGKEFHIPYTGVVKPTAFAAAKATRNRKVGVIGTTATINSCSYKQAIEKMDSNIQVFQQDCPLFVPLVENGFINRNDIVVKTVVQRYLQPLIENNIDTLILGCTHYPILRDVIADVMGEEVILVDSGKETARYAAKLINEYNLANPQTVAGTCEYYVSDTVDGFSKFAGLFLGNSVDQDVHRIKIEHY